MPQNDIHCPAAALGFFRVLVLRRGLNITQYGVCREESCRGLLKRGVWVNLLNPCCLRLRGGGEAICIRNLWSSSRNKIVTLLESRDPGRIYDTVLVYIVLATGILYSTGILYP